VAWSRRLFPLLVVSLVVASPIFLAITVLTTGFANAPLDGIVLAAAGAVVGSVLGRSLYFLGINYLGPGKSLSINATSPLSAALLAWIILEESITALVVGTVGIVLGIVTLSRDVHTQTTQEDHSLPVALFPLVGAIFAAVAVTPQKRHCRPGSSPSRRRRWCTSPWGW
jgi:drug/metabolite transporter (DMT)-like permease